MKSEFSGAHKEQQGAVAGAIRAIWRAPFLEGSHRICPLGVQPG